MEPTPNVDNGKVDLNPNETPKVPAEATGSDAPSELVFNLRQGDIRYIPEYRILMKVDDAGHEAKNTGSDPCFVSVLFKPCKETELRNPLTLSEDEEGVAGNTFYQSECWSSLYQYRPVAKFWVGIEPLEIQVTYVEWNGETIQLRLRKKIPPTPEEVINSMRVLYD